MKAFDSQVERHINIFNETTLASILNIMPLLIFILNSERKIVYHNNIFKHFFGSNRDFNGLYPGEAMGCANAINLAGGCGKAEACECCTTSQKIERAIKDTPKSHSEALRILNYEQAGNECQIRKEDGEQLELRVRVRRLEI